jgi:hypothetical protein
LCLESSGDEIRVAELAVNVDGTWRGPSRGILKAIAKSPYLRKLKKVN